MAAFAPISDLQRVVDTLAIQNLMGRRAYYHVAGRNDLEFGLYADLPDITWRQNQGAMVGPDAIRAYYVEANFAMQDDALRALRTAHPEIEVAPENRGMGSFIMHTLTTPVIVVADDGDTAKGMWYTPGAIALGGPEGVTNAMWMWERYAVDFVKQDGEWRFWHIFVMTDFMVEMGGSLKVVEDESAAHVGSEVADSTGFVPDWSVEEAQYEDWRPTRPTVYNLEPPKPYRTFSETTSYGLPAA